MVHSYTESFIDYRDGQQMCIQNLLLRFERWNKNNKPLP